MDVDSLNLALILGLALIGSGVGCVITALRYRNAIFPAAISAVVMLMMGVAIVYSQIKTWLA